MTTTLRDQILAQQLLKKKEQAAANRDKDKFNHCVSAVKKLFEERLERYLHELSDIEYFIVDESDLQGESYLNEVFEELGFEKDSSCVPLRIFLRVPYPKDGAGTLTYAQTRILEFKEKLKDLQEQTKKNVLKKCEIIKQDILAGHYEYSELQRDTTKFVSIEGSFLVFSGSYQKEILTDFFENEGLVLIHWSANKLDFKLI